MTGWSHAVDAARIKAFVASAGFMTLRPGFGVSRRKAIALWQRRRVASKAIRLSMAGSAYVAKIVCLKTTGRTEVRGSPYEEQVD